MFNLSHLTRLYMNEAGAEEQPASGGDVAAAAAPPATGTLLGGQEEATAAEPFLSALPEEGDADGWGALYNKLGRPETAEGYELPLPEGDNGEFAKATSAWMHEAGLSKSQAQALAGKWNEYQAAQAEQGHQQLEQQNTQNLASIRKEWGNNFDANAAVVGQAMTRFATPEVRQLINDSGMGNNPGLVSMFLKIGQSLSEAKAVNGTQADASPKSTAEVFYGSN